MKFFILKYHLNKMDLQKLLDQYMETVLHIKLYASFQFIILKNYILKIFSYQGEKDNSIVYSSKG